MTDDDLLLLNGPLLLQSGVQIHAAQLPRKWFDGGGDPLFPRFCPAPPPGSMTACYTMRMTALAQDREARFSMDPGKALELYNSRDARRGNLWTARFS